MKLKNNTFEKLQYQIRERILILQTIADHAAKLHSIISSVYLNSKQEEILALLIEKYQLKDGDDYSKMLKEGLEMEMYMLNRQDDVLRTKMEDAPVFLLKAYEERVADKDDDEDDVTWQDFLEEFTHEESRQFILRWLPIKNYIIPDVSNN